MIAAGDIILSSGHLSVDELKVLYPDAKRRGVKKMTIFGSDLGLVKMPRPVEGYRAIVNDLLDLQVPRSDIRELVGGNAVDLL